MFVCKKLPDADEVCEANWKEVEAQIKKEELEDEDLLYDDEDDEEEEHTDTAAS